MGGDVVSVLVGGYEGGVGERVIREEVYGKVGVKRVGEMMG
ncbi:hypothetical protein [Paenibacillus sp. Y412MC10]|nr:hypothetical protein [Paenibacillus sp. Y412MC10]